jgi:hypothetical protein
MTEVVAISLDIDSHYETKLFLYVVPRLESYDMILRLL